MTTNTSHPRPDDIRDARLLSPAWLIGGLRNVPGYLGLIEGRLWFSDGEPVFDIGVAEARSTGDITWPWWWFGGGLKLTAAGKRYKITFIRPNGMPSPEPSMLGPALNLLGSEAGVGSLGDLAGLADIHKGRGVAKQWKVLLPPSAG